MPESEFFLNTLEVHAGLDDSCPPVQAGSAARYELEVGPLGECSAACGGGQAQRSLACMDTIIGLPVDMSLCNLDIASLSNLTEPCNTQGCAQTQKYR